MNSRLGGRLGAGARGGQISRLGGGLRRGRRRRARRRARGRPGSRLLRLGTVARSRGIHPDPDPGRLTPFGFVFVARHVVAVVEAGEAGEGVILDRLLVELDVAQSVLAVGLGDDPIDEQGEALVCDVVRDHVLPGRDAGAGRETVVDGHGHVGRDRRAGELNVDEGGRVARLEVDGDPVRGSRRLELRGGRRVDDDGEGRRRWSLGRRHDDLGLRRLGRLVRLGLGVRRASRHGLLDRLDLHSQVDRLAPARRAGSGNRAEGVAARDVAGVAPRRAELQLDRALPVLEAVGVVRARDVEGLGEGERRLERRRDVEADVAVGVDESVGGASRAEGLDRALVPGDGGRAAR